MSHQDPEHTLQQLLDTLPREHLPQRDLWPGIAYALQPAHHQRRLPAWLALAASLLLVLSASLYYGLRQPGSGFDRADLNVLISALQSDHERSKQALLVQYQGRAAVYTDWQAQMQELEDAEQAIYAALRQDPENLALLNILRQVQDKQIMLIDAVFAPRARAI
ncbi:MAG TPA: hypothetical protein VNR18_09310 [Hyphomicrobiales bacterium]|nr:hypothetical protein [Hyphomicrobiales bacterium]